MQAFFGAVMAFLGVEGMTALGAGIAALACVGAAIGMGMTTSKAVESMAGWNLVRPVPDRRAVPDCGQSAPLCPRGGRGQGRCGGELGRYGHPPCRGNGMGRDGAAGRGGAVSLENGGMLSRNFRVTSVSGMFSHQFTARFRQSPLEIPAPVC